VLINSATVELIRKPPNNLDENENTKRLRRPSQKHCLNVVKTLANHVRVHEKGSYALMDLIESGRTKQGFQKAGAIAVFIGVARGETLKGEKVQKLEIEAYEEKADEVLTNICNDLKRREGIMDVQIHHLLGEFNVGEDLVYVLVAGSHRMNVFPVLKEAVDRYKKEAPIFKKEYITNRKEGTTAYWVTEHKAQ
jgi:molybdopterin synthase catalytic subunit